MIEELIPKQNFEIVRDSLGFILKSEIISQQQKQDSLFTEDVSVFLERTTPISNAEEVVLNIVLTSSDYNNKTQKDSQGKTFYNIDIYSRGIATQGKSGSENSALKLHRYIGFVRYVLQHTAYKTLNLPGGIIGGTTVESFNIVENIMNQDTDFIKIGTVLFSARIQEWQELENPVNLSEIFTGVKLDLTEKGYEFKKENQ